MRERDAISRYLTLHIREGPSAEARFALRVRVLGQEGVLRGQRRAACELSGRARAGVRVLAPHHVDVGGEPAAEAASEHVKLTCRWHAAHGRYATALEALSQSVGKDKKPVPKETLERKAELLSKLGWAHWAKAVTAQVAVRFPSAYPPVFNHELTP